MVGHSENLFKHISWKVMCLAIMFIFTIYAFGSGVTAENESINPKYLKILPGKSTRTDVENLFPQAIADDSGGSNTADFMSEELAIGVEYSRGRCGAFSMPDWGKFPKGIVVLVSYEWPGDDRVPLDSVIYDLEKFKKSQSSDVAVHVNYRDEDSGIDVVYDTQMKSVVGIYLTPPAKYRKEYVCQ
jgi:hypothetical protein